MTHILMSTQWLTRNSSVATVEALIETLVKTYKVFSFPIPRWNRNGCRSIFGRKIAVNSGKFIWSMRFADAMTIYTPLQYMPEFTRILFGYLAGPVFAFDMQVRDRKHLLRTIAGIVWALNGEIDRRTRVALDRAGVSASS
jgi:hypothetical protein